MSVFDGLKARLDRLFAEQAARPDERARAALLREALLEAKVALRTMRDALEQTARALAAERKQLADAERRGKLAADIADSETAEVAQRFAAKHRDRAEVLERKLRAQRDELALAERDTTDMSSRFHDARLGVSEPARSRADAAWRDVEAAGGIRPETDLQQELLRSELDRARNEAAVEQQLAYLKRKMRNE
jgi:hypothetical protein